MAIPQHFLNELMTRVDIVDIIEKRIQLKKTGTNYSAVCPFHNEKTPSFTVSPSKQFYYCFGCGEHGNAIKFMMAFDKLDFLDVVETLAQSVGMEIPQDTHANKKPEFKQMYDTMSNIANLYYKILFQNEIAKNYLKQRGLNKEIVRQFKIGFSPDAWDTLAQHIRNNKERTTELLTAGMLVKKNDHCYDRFRNRIMFPVHDLRGRVVAFGGRALGDETPKYLNSPETPIYHKSTELYGLYQSRQQHSQLDRVIIVEGYLDVIALFQNGIDYAVATLGTATTRQHLHKLLRYTKELFFCFDGDAAGKKAAWRALTIALPIMRDGIEIKFMFLPEGEDPDSLVRKEKKEGFLKRLSQATPLANFFFDALTEHSDTNTTGGKAKLANQAAELLKTMPQGVYQQLLYDKLAALVEINVEQLKDLHQAKNSQIPPLSLHSNKPNTDIQSTTPEPQKIETHSPLLKKALIILLNYPELGRELNLQTDMLEADSEGLPVLRKIIDSIKQTPGITAGGLLTTWDKMPTIQNQLAQMAVAPLLFPKAALKDELDDCIHRLQQSLTTLKIDSLLTKGRSSSLTPEERLKLQELISKKTQHE